MSNTELTETTTELVEIRLELAKLCSKLAKICGYDEREEVLGEILNLAEPLMLKIESELQGELISLIDYVAENPDLKIELAVK